jgi:hypothetical protein
MTNDIGFPFQGRVWYWVEDSYGVRSVPTSTVTLPVSCYIQDARIGSGDRSKPIMDIQAAQVVELMSLVTEPTLHLEYNPQAGDTLFDDVVDRTSCCTLQSLAIMVETNKCMPDGDDSHFYFTGCKANTVSIAGGKGEPYTISIDFLAKSVSTAMVTVPYITAPAPLAGIITTFNLAGSIVYGTGHSAYVTNALNITFNNNLSPYIGIGGTTLAYLVEGAQDVSGSVDITLDGGGGVHFNDVVKNTAFTLTLTTGAAVGSIIITLPGCEWTNSEIDKNVSGEAMIESAPFVCALRSCITNGSCVTTLVTAVT